MMKRMRVAPLFWVTLGLCAAGCSAGASLQPVGGAQAQASPLGGGEHLTAANEQELRAIVNRSRLEKLQWPDFSDYGKWVKEFYEAGNYQLEWSRSGKPTAPALAVIGILKEAEKKGLDSNDYDGARWAERQTALEKAKESEQSSLVNFDVALTVSAMRYISDLHLGKVDPKLLHKDFDPERHKYDLAEFLRQRVIEEGNVRESFESVEPLFAGYHRALGALLTYWQLAQVEAPDPLPMVKKPLAPGQEYEATPKLVRRLQFLGDLPDDASAPADSHVYAGEVVEGVKRFQDRHGLEAKGKLGPETIAELNRPMSARVEQLRLSLERWRWVPHEFEEPPIVVNIPEFLLRAYDRERKLALTMPVVVGRAIRTETPVMEEDMKYLVFWPYWNVPPSILRNEIVPKIVKDPAYLQKNDYEVATYSGEVVTDGVVSEEVLAQLKSRKLMVRQKPGPKNALGLIKFIFPNDENIYLHSTPSQSLFAKNRRDFSHGCVRVEDPAALAEWVLRNNPGWTRERIDAAFKAEKEQQVNLTRTIPVLIVYGTAIVPENGKPHFLQDIYGYDKSLAERFQLAYASRR
jgi:L,D-transpeptidase YcbB